MKYMLYLKLPQLLLLFLGLMHMRLRKGEVQGETKGININGVFVADCSIYVTLYV